MLLSDYLGPTVNIVAKSFVKSPIAYLPSEGYTRQDQYSNISIQWLEWKMHQDHIFIRHSLNHSEGEKMILADGHRYRVDGFCETTNTVYEYHGCFFHGCPTCHARGDRVKHPRTGQSMSELYALAIKKEASLKKLGY